MDKLNYGFIVPSVNVLKLEKESFDKYMVGYTKYLSERVHSNVVVLDNSVSYSIASEINIVALPGILFDDKADADKLASSFNEAKVDIMIPIVRNSAGKKQQIFSLLSNEKEQYFTLENRQLSDMFKEIQLVAFYSKLGKKFNFSNLLTFVEDHFKENKSPTKKYSAVLNRGISFTYNPTIAV